MTGVNTRAGFDIDLREFAAFEGDLIRVLISRGSCRIEHKRDCRAVTTGNLFVEYRQPSGKSGIASTESDMWAFEYDENMWLIVPRERLREACVVAFKQGRTTKGGDGKRYHGVLVPIRWLIPPYLEEAR